MKKSIIISSFILIVLTSFFGCSGNRPSYEQGDKIIIRDQCLSAVSESKFDELNKVCNAKDEEALQRMILDGNVYIISSYTNAKMIDPGFVKSKIEIDISGKIVSVYVANEFLPKKH